MGNAQFKRVEQVLADLSLKFTRSVAVSGYEITFGKKEPPFNGFAIVDEDGARFVFYLLLAAPIPTNKRTAVMELITRVNLDMLAGCFELDLESGELRFRTYFDYTGISLAKASIEHTIRGALEAVNIYYPALDKVVRRNQKPRAVIEAIERSLD